MLTSALSKDFPVVWNALFLSWIFFSGSCEMSTSLLRPEARKFLQTYVTQVYGHDYDDDGEHDDDDDELVIWQVLLSCEDIKIVLIY